MIINPKSEDIRAEYYVRLCEDFFDRAVYALRRVPILELGTAVQALEDARRRGSRVYVLGNGGSASTASHLVCDLVRAAKHPTQRPLRVFALVDNTPLFTAYANDLDYAEVFASQLESNAEQGDVVIAVSASGRSPNVLSALRIACRMGLYSMGLLGCDGGMAAKLVNLPLIIDSTDFGVIETAHLGIAHALAAALGAPDLRAATASTQKAVRVD